MGEEFAASTVTAHNVLDFGTRQRCLVCPGGQAQAGLELADVLSPRDDFAAVADQRKSLDTLIDTLIDTSEVSK